MLQIFLFVHEIVSLTMTEACVGAKTITSSWNVFSSLDLNQGEYACMDGRSSESSQNIYCFIAFGEGLKFEGFTDNICKQTSEGSFISTYLVTKVTATVSTTINYVETSILKSTSQVDYFYQICLESKYSGRITTTRTSSLYTLSIFLYMNPSGGRVTVKPDSNTLASVNDFNGRDEMIKTQQTYSGQIFMIMAMEDTFASGITDFNVDIKIEALSTPLGYPEVTLSSLAENVLYGSSVDDECQSFTPKTPEPSSDTGAIVGIVIAVIVVVAIIVFCIIWFVVLKKSCPFSKNENAEVDA